MSTLHQVVINTRNKLAGAIGRDRINVLNDNYSATATTLGLVYTPGVELAAGVVIEIDYEQMIVVSHTTTSVTVIRGWNGTTATTHSANALVYCDPRFPLQSILNDVIHELRALPPTIFQIGTAVLEFNSSDNRVDLTGATGEVWRILTADRANTDGDSYAGFRPVLKLIRNADTASFPSGYAVALDKGLSYKTPATVRVVYAKSLSITTLTSTTNLQTTVGLPITAEDILELGAASRLMYDKEALRLDFTRQGASRAAEELPPEVQARLAERWRGEANRRISEEATRLISIWGVSGV